MAKPKRIGHLVLNVKDVDASTKFYTDVLGFEIILGAARFRHLPDLRQGPPRPGPFPSQGSAQQVSEGGLGLNHMAIQVEDYEELKDYYTRLQEYYEVAELRTVDHSMTKSIYITDPDGTASSCSATPSIPRRGLGGDAPSRTPEHGAGVRLDNPINILVETPVKALALPNGDCFREGTNSSLNFWPLPTRP